MNYKTKKILALSATSVFAGAAAITGLSIYFTTPASVRIPEKDLYLIRLNAKQDTSAYKYDVSSSSGPNASLSTASLVTNELIHMKSEGKLLIQRQPDGTNKITPSYQSFQFSLADNIVAVLQKKTDTNDKIQLVFDSDDAEFPNVPDNNQDTIINKTSSNKRSINNKDIFIKLLETGAISKKVNSVNELETTDIISGGEYVLTKLGFTVKENVPWVNSDGEPTPYMLKADDFWYSFMRSKLFDRDYRRANGGSKGLDEFFIEKTKTSTLFQDNGRFTNEYLFGFFDLDVTKLYDRNTAIQTVNVNGKDREMFTFSSLDETKATNGFLSAIQKLLANSLLFSAAPSDRIKEIADDDRLNTNLGKDKLSINGQARDFGIYTYGETRKEVLYASVYIPVSTVENRDVFEYNRHFANKKMVDEIEGRVPATDPNTKKPIRPLKRVIFEYSGGIDTSTFNSQLLSSYLKGNVSQAVYTDLSLDQRIKIFGGHQGSLEEMEQQAMFNGLQYNKVNNVSTFVQRTMVQSNPTNNVDNVSAYGFNDQYSKIVFGLTREQLKEGKSTTTDNFFVNEGLEFRLLVQAAINWDAYIKQSFQNQRVFWLNGAAQHAQFSNFAPEKPIDKYEEVNTLEFVDRVTNPNQKTLVQVKPSEMKQHSTDNNNNDIESLKSPKFEQIKQNMKSLLDEVYPKNNWNQNQKVQWEIVYGYADNDVLRTTIMQKIVDIITSLDPRLQPVLITPNTAEEMVNKIARNTGVTDFNGWGYDYEGIGSYIAAFASGIGVTLMNAFDIFSQDQPPATRPELFNWFPQFRKLALFIKQEVQMKLDQLKSQLVGTPDYNEKEFNKLYVDQWAQLTNANNQKIDEFFKSRSGGKYQINTKLAKLFRKYEDYEDPATQKKQTAQDWADLIREFNSLRSVSMDLDNSISDPNINNLSLFLREYIIPASHQGILFLQDFRIQDLKK